MQGSSTYCSFRFRPLIKPPITKARDGVAFSGEASQRVKGRPFPVNSVFAYKKRDDDHGGFGYDETGSNNHKMVDEGMIVLRKRIREVKAAEEAAGDGDGGFLPSHWMEWEKRYYCDIGGYHSDIVEAVGLLQRFLMDSRPSLALGLAAMLAISVPMSVTVVVWQLMTVCGGATLLLSELLATFLHI